MRTPERSPLGSGVGERNARRKDRVQGIHIPVLFQAVLDGLQVGPGGRYIDATVGGGGHSAGILAASSPDGQLLGIDRDSVAVDTARLHLAEYEGRAVFVHGSFAHLREEATAHDFVPADGILFDLGLSSLQLADPSRGFAFAADGPLDMRFDTQAGDVTAADLVNDLPAEELTRLLRQYGEEKHARRIVEAIVAARPLLTTRELAVTIEQAVPRRGRTHPATRTFQALRIVVNDELGQIQAALPQAVEILKPGGRLVAISFHSLEDRLVKRFLRRESSACVCPPGMPVCTCNHQASLRLITRKPIFPEEDEVVANPRARSARLRVAERAGE